VSPVPAGQSSTRRSVLPSVRGTG